jgi:S-adenosyl-L-methionine hydrolase (adenosine-forming)
VAVARPIVFCSDYGLADGFVGVCHGVIARIAPDARVIDLTHGIPAMDVLGGAAALRAAVRYMPDDAVYLAVVDPGVGTARRAVAVETTNGQPLVGPDNGVLSLAWERLGGAALAVEITALDVILQPTSHTFHGRDVFAPAAACLAKGMDLEALGPPIDVESLKRIDLPRPQVVEGEVRCRVLSIDRFGNVQLAAGEDDLVRATLDNESELVLDTDEVGEISLRRALTFNDVRPGQAALIVDSAGWLAAAVNGGNLAEAARLEPGDPVLIRR